jgi:undecaprenyl-diphosphatase
MDYFVFHWLNNFAGQNSILDGFAVFCSEYLQYLVVAVFVFFLVKNLKKYLQMVFCAFCSIFLSRVVFTETIRYFFPKNRPFVSEQVNQLLQHSESASFPSGHAAFFFALATAVYFYNKKLGGFFFVSAFLISIARVFCGIHWPSDILAGALIGIFSGWLMFKFFKKYFQKISDKTFAIISTKKRP